MKTITQSKQGKLAIGWALMVSLVGILYLIIDALRTGGMS